MREFYLEIAHGLLLAEFHIDIGGVRQQVRRLGSLARSFVKWGKEGCVLGSFLSGAAVLGIETQTDLF